MLTLNRPQARNSLSEAMLAALADEPCRDRGRPRVRAVVLAANGPAFCAGHDLKEMTARRSDPDRRPRLFPAADGRLQRDDAGDRRTCRSR